METLIVVLIGTTVFLFLKSLGTDKELEYLRHKVAELEGKLND